MTFVNCFFVRLNIARAGAEDPIIRRTGINCLMSSQHRVPKRSVRSLFSLFDAWFLASVALASVTQWKIFARPPHSSCCVRRWCKRSSAPHIRSRIIISSNVAEAIRANIMFSILFRVLCATWFRVIMPMRIDVKVRTTDTYKPPQKISHFNFSSDSPPCASCDARLVGRGPTRSRSETTLKKRTQKHTR